MAVDGWVPESFERTLSSMQAVQTLTLDLHFADDGMPNGTKMFWARSASHGNRTRRQLLCSLGRALSTLRMLRSLKIVCHSVPAATLGWGDTRLLNLLQLQLPLLTELRICLFQRSGVNSEPPAFALTGIGPQCELPSLRSLGKSTVFVPSATCVPPGHKST